MLTFQGCGEVIRLKLLVNKCDLLVTFVSCFPLKQYFENWKILPICFFCLR